MRLLVDIGNTRIKAALWSEDDMQSLPALVYADQELPALLDSWELPGNLVDCWVASVGHADICAVLDDWLAAGFGVQAVFPKSTAAACGVTNAYATPHNLGVDRWLGLIAAHAQGGSAIVVSAGTAATIDAVGADGGHLGGLITPGIATQRRAMLDHTQVRANTDGQSIELLGNGTDSCVTYGTVHAVAGYVDRVASRLKAQDANWRMLLTGGDAGLLLPELADDWSLVPDLVLQGLAILANSAE